MKGLEDFPVQHERDLDLRADADRKPLMTGPIRMIRDLNRHFQPILGVHPAVSKACRISCGIEPFIVACVIYLQAGSFVSPAAALIESISDRGIVR